MKLQFAIVIGVILVGSIATVNWAFIPDNEVSANSLKSSAGMLGHITLTAVNEDGNIIAYRQTDNVVINTGDNCIAEDIFGTDFASCAGTAVFDKVHIGIGTAAFTETSTDIASLNDSVTGVFTTTGAATSTGGASVTLQAAFTDVSAAIAEAALKNGSAGSDVLALQSFTPISLGPTDDLTIDWTVTVDGN